MSSYYDSPKGYHRSQYSLHGTGRSKQDFVGQAIHSKVAMLLESRYKVLAPFPIRDTYGEIFRYAFNEAEFNAWEILKEHSKFKNTVHQTGLLSLKDTPGEGKRLLIDVSYMMPNISVHWDKLPGYTQNIIGQWLVKSNSFINEREAILNLIQHLCQQCTTPGQLKRTWPELLSFMVPSAKDKVFKAGAKSPYPSGVIEIVDGGGIQLEEQWRPDNLEWINIILTEALVLPEWESEDEYPKLRSW